VRSRARRSCDCSI